MVSILQLTVVGQSTISYQHDQIALRFPSLRKEEATPRKKNGRWGGGKNKLNICVSIIRLFNPYSSHSQNVLTAASLSFLEFIFLTISYYLTISMIQQSMGEF